MARGTQHRPATPVEGDFWGSFKPFDENSKNTCVPLGLAPAKSGLTRFLTDYLNGDKYFHIDYDDQNLDRSRCQLTLAKDMIRKYDDMAKIVKKYCE